MDSKSPKQAQHPSSETTVALELDLWPGLGQAGLGNEQVEGTLYAWETMRRQESNCGPWTKRW